MKKISVKLLIYNLMKKTIGTGLHQLHEPLFIGNKIKFNKDTIKKNLSQLQDNMWINLKKN